jgi:hypothetical protein
MSKIYQPFILEKVEEVITALVETNFFEENELESDDFARKYLSDLLTQKFITGQLDSDTTEIFTEDEFGMILKEIIVGTVLNDLKGKGFVNSYEDDNTEEIFFLTTEGKEYLRNVINKDNL